MDRFRMPTGGSNEDLRVKLLAFADAIDDLGLADEFDACGHELTVAGLRQMKGDFTTAKASRAMRWPFKVGATSVLVPV